MITRGAQPHSHAGCGKPPAGLHGTRASPHAWGILLGCFLVCLSTSLKELPNEGRLLLDFLGKKKSEKKGVEGEWEFLRVVKCQEPAFGIWGLALGRDLVSHSFSQAVRGASEGGRAETSGSRRHWVLLKSPPCALLNLQTPKSL